MLKPVGMSKIRLIVIKSAIEKVVEELHNLGVVEINKTSYSSLDSGRPLDSHTQISSELVRVRALKSSLENYISKDEIKISKDYLDYKEALKIAMNLDIENGVKNSVNQISKAQDEIKSLKEQKKLLDTLAVFGEIDFSKLNTNSLSYIVGLVNSENLEKCKSIMDKNVRHYNMNLVSLGNQKIVLIIFSKADFSIENLLSSCGFSSISVPKDVGLVSEKLQKVTQNIKLHYKEMEDSKAKLQELSKSYYSKLVGLEKALSVLSDRSEIVSRFSSTSSVFIIEGWIKKDDFANLQKALDKYEDKVSLDMISFDSHQETPPVELKNPEIASSVQFITKQYSLPGYEEIDPTLIYFITLPLIYGMIVGDVLYGLISIPIALFFMKKFPKSEILQSVSKLWLYGAIPSIAFGIYFDEWFGISHFKWLEFLKSWGIDAGINAPLYKGVSRVEDLTTVLGLTALIGLIHLGLGFILGAINEWNHSKKHALAKIFWLGIEIGGTIVVCSMLLTVLPASFSQIGLIILGVSIIGLAFTEGPIGLIEVPGFAGNVLSYMRIAAVGVVGAILAEIINQSLTPKPELGLLALAILPFFIILHLANGFIAMFESLIQGGRLNILEFRSKFLKGSNKYFEPFALSLYSKEK